jgi:O-antigen/teichoic acid export membrane protein
LKESAFALPSLQRTLLRNSATMMVSKLLSAAISLLMVPLIVSRIGIIGYGIWEAVLAVAMIGAIFQNAITGTLLWKAAGQYAAGDVAAVTRTLRVGLALVACELAVVFPLAWVFRFPILDVLQVPRDYSASIEYVAPATVLAVVVVGVSDSIGSIVSACHETGALALAQTASQLVNYGVVIGCLASGMGLLSVPAGMAAGAAFTSALLLAVTRRLLGGASILPCVPTAAELRSIWPYTRSMMIGSVAITMRGQVTKVLTASVASPVWTGYYGIANRLASAILLTLSFFSLPAVSAFGALHAKGRIPELKTLYLRLLVIVSVCAGAVTVLVAGLHDRLLILWLGEYIVDVAPILIVLVCTNTIVTMLTGIGSSLCKGIGRPDVETRYVVVGLMLNVILLPLGIISMGAMGVVLAGALSYVLSAAYFVLILQAEFDPPKRSYHVMAATAAAMLVASLCTRFLSSHAPLGFSRLHALGWGTILGVAGLSTFGGVIALLRVVTWSSVVNAKAMAE